VCSYINVYYRLHVSGSLWPFVFSFNALYQFNAYLFVSSWINNGLIWSFFFILIIHSLQLPVWVQRSHHCLATHVAFEFFSSSSWFTSHFAFNNFMQKVQRCVSKHDQSIDVSLPNRDQYLHVFTYSPENLSISNFIKPTDLCYSSPYPHFKCFQSSSNLLSESTSMFMLHIVLHSRQ